MHVPIGPRYFTCLYDKKKARPFGVMANQALLGHALTRSHSTPMVQNIVLALWARRYRHTMVPSPRIPSPEDRQCRGLKMSIRGALEKVLHSPALVTL